MVEDTYIRSNDYQDNMANMCAKVTSTYMEKDIFNINQNELTYGRGYV